jgi:hypothetical protein
MLHSANVSDVQDLKLILNLMQRELYVLLFT